ncbi:MAG TPA: GDP-mannose 4,6-dehydratase, partial [Solirubrobacteraceae bacterium]|nr:GDP-mannose 4,6-dehydratase [Solirubrobacteraceae bacterium]
MRILVCGGAGFIGSTFVRQRVLEHGDEVLVLDKLTYAGRRENLEDLEGHPGFGGLVAGGIEDGELVGATAREGFEGAGAEAIVNFAAETHVDRSISEPDAFVMTNLVGTYRLLEATRELGLPYVHV